MAAPTPDRSDESLERPLGNLLRVGVVTAAAVVLLGGGIYLVRHGHEPADHRNFHGEPAALRHPVGILTQALSIRGRGIIQLGLLLLIATPVARVAFSLLAFTRRRDVTYAALTAVVLAVLLYGLFAGV